MNHIHALALCASLIAPAEVTTSSIDSPWIVQQQREDGSWSASGDSAPIEGFRPGLRSDDVMVTALQVLSFLGDGQTPQAGPWRANVAKALDWISARRDDSGCLAEADSPTLLADHALATLALTEATYLGADESTREAARSALAYLEARSLPQGGWSRNASPKAEVDLRASAWATMALASGRDASLTERPELIAAAAWRLRGEGSRREFSKREGAFELLVRMLAGETVEHSPEYAKRLETLAGETFEWRADGKGFDPERIYLQSLIAYQSGGDTWKVYVDGLKRLQESTGPKVPARLAVDASLPGGSMAGFAFGTLTLEVYFRYARVIGAR